MIRIMMKETRWPFRPSFLDPFFPLNPLMNHLTLTAQRFISCRPRSLHFTHTVNTSVKYPICLTRTARVSPSSRNKTPRGMPLQERNQRRGEEERRYLRTVSYDSRYSSHKRSFPHPPVFDFSSRTSSLTVNFSVPKTEIGNLNATALPLTGTGDSFLK